MANVLITGGTGLIGRALTKELLRLQHKVTVLTRTAKPSENGVAFKVWNIENGTVDIDAIREADTLVHLAGANVAEGRWTDQRKREIVDSRVKSGQLLVKALTELPNAVQTIVSASAIGWYGADPQVPNPKPFVETDPPDTFFLGDTCVKWEEAIAPAAGLGKRLVYLRTGIVLSREAGAYAAFRKPLTVGVAPLLGGGGQMVSWIHIDDVVQLYVDAIVNSRIHGIYNAVAPNPVSNRELILTMAKTRNKFYLPIPVPAPALKLALGEMSVEILKSATVSSRKIAADGFRFQYPTIRDAVKALEAK